MPFILLVFILSGGVCLFVCLFVVFLSVPFILLVVILSGGVWGIGYGINTHGNASVEMVKTHTICDNMQVLNTNTNILYNSLEFIWIP